MENFDFAAQPPVRRDRIYVSWTEQWELARYVDDYLESRKLRRDEEARAKIQRSIEEFQIHGALRKADVDYYLDVNVRPELQLPAEMGVRREKNA
jgi:predicted alpha-1,6-mannanase (GH76 family)